MIRNGLSLFLKLKLKYARENIYFIYLYKVIGYPTEI